MLTGLRLFKGETLTQILHNVASFEPPPPSQIKPEITPMLDLVVKRAMEKKPSARYASAWEMADDLRQCLQELELLAPTSQGSADSPAKDGAPAADAYEKTVMLKPPASNRPVPRRMSADVETDNRLSLSRRFDSDAALIRLQTPTPRDRKRLARLPRSPGLLRRLRHDRDLAWFSLTLGLAILVAGTLALS